MKYTYLENVFDQNLDRIAELIYTSDTHKSLQPIPSTDQMNLRKRYYVKRSSLICVCLVTDRARGAWL
jgi:hypothetical protein